MFLLRAITLIAALFFCGTSAITFADQIKLSISIRDLGTIRNLDYLEAHFSKEQIQSLKNLPVQGGKDFQLIKNDQGTFALTPCLFNVYQWTSEGWNNCYLYDNSGYNCGAKFFFRNGQLFSLGTYGFWRNHSDLLSFDSATGSWSLFPTQNQPIDYGAAYTGVGEKGAFLFFGVKQNYRFDNHQDFEQGYFLNFEDFSWQYLSFGNLISTSSSLADFVIHENYLDTKDFMVFSGFSSDPQIGFLIFEKNTLEFRFIKMERAIEILNNPSWILQQANQATISAVRDNPFVLNFDDLYQKAEYVGEAEVLPISAREIEELQNDYILISLGMLIATGVIVFWVLRKEILKVKHLESQKESIETKPQSQKNSDQKLIELFEPFQGKVLTVEQIDQILLINDIPNPDHKKVKRSRLIKEVNQLSESHSGEALIVRKRNPEDKRFIIYEIQNKVPTSLN
ncbi:hypothetical protein [Algoriphagus formosus]|uniref:hypothetical protein n=1 Tax=Algoriphagus formosus TaxID=2007308 RepID=UPI000C28E84F|nr:hypothetical protein [Algoriphagus formosus]